AEAGALPRTVLLRPAATGATSRSWSAVGTRHRTAGPKASSPEITEPLRPATRSEANPPGLEPGPARLELAVPPLHRGFAGARPVELHPQESNADGWSRTTTARGGRVTAC